MSTPIHVLDLSFQGAAEAVAAFLILGPSGPVLVECGPGSTLPALVAALARHSLTPRDIGDVLITHIHLDHSGSAGWWARQGARIHVHPFGAPHLIDPSKLLQSAARIYGDQMQTLWGEYLASPAAQVHEVRDGEVVEAGGLRFTAHDTPGHARHHLVYQLGEAAFTGDLAGIRLSGRPHTRIPSPPPEFDREAWLASIARMRSLRLTRLYLTHFGAVEDVDAHWARTAQLVEASADWARGVLEAGLDREATLAQFRAREDGRMAADGLTGADLGRYASIGPLGMSLDGLLRYWKKKLEG